MSVSRWSQYFFAVVSGLSLDRIDITTSERAALGILRGMEAWMGGWQTLIVYSKIDVESMGDADDTVV
jgi:hypothetical protein